MRVTRNSSMSAPSLCSAFAMADSSAFLISPAAFFCVNDRMFRALSTGLPRTRSATSRPFWADRRAPLTIAVVSIVLTLLLRHSGLLVRCVALEGPRQREFAELVTDHVFVDVDRHVLLAVVHGDREADELRQDGRAPGPRLDRLLVARGLCSFDFLLQMPVDKRALLERTRHSGPLTSVSGAARSSCQCACCCACDSPCSACPTG